MFARRKRAASNPHPNLNVNADPSATTAAAQAFLARSKSNATLSAAAAATALRSRPTSPTNVAEVQTKRTMRRENSGSPRASSVPARASSQLERRRSSSSMSERTFRDPSPVRGAARPSAPDAPPVPTIPENLIEQASPTPVRRPSSVQPAPTRVSSPPVNPGTGRGLSLQPTMRTPAQTRSGPRVTSMSNIQELTSVDRPSSRGSVNFSLPTSLRRSSSAAQWMLTPRQSSQALNGSELVFDPNTRTLRTRADMLFYEQGLREASQKPVMRKKNLRQEQGSHFSEGSVGGRLKGTALDGLQRQNVHERQAQQTSQGILSEEFPRSQRVASPRNSIRDSSDNESEASERTSKYNNRAGSQQLSNKPSMVREERQREEDEDDSVKVLGRQAALRKLESANRDDRHISPSPLPRSKPGRARKQAENIGSNVQQDQPRMEVTEAPVTQAETAPAQIPAPAQETAPKPEAPIALAPLDTATKAPIALAPLDTATKALRMEKQADRAHSVSPTRAHFLATPSPVSQFSIRHEPPARSISPRKSALKPSPSRGPSPMGYTPTGWTAGPSSGDVSDASTNQSEERTVPKKKSVRVSFDERNNVVVGEEPEVPEARRTWTSGYIRGNKATSPIEDGPDEIMGPRPVLPSFGSVRKKQPKDLEDRPLVKPVGPQGPSPAISPSSSGSEYFAGQSSNHAVGSLLQQERNLRAAPSVSNSNDQLPPEVISVEGSGYVSDSGSSTHSFVVGKAVTVHLAVKGGDAQKTAEAGGKPGFIEDLGVIPEVETPGDDAVREQLEEFPTEPRQEDAAAHDSKTNGNGNAPTFTVTQPTPLPEQGEFQHQSPSGLNGNTWESENAKEIPLKDYIAGKKVAGGAVAVQNILDVHPVTADAESSDGDSIYSDAAEELSNNGDGFMSLDDVLGGKEPSVKAAETPKAPDSGEGWDESQRFWSGLSADKRRQMELDALLENDEEREEREDSEDEVPYLKPLKQASVAKAETTVKEKQRAKNAAAAGVIDRTYQITPGAKAGPDGVPRAPKPRQEDGHMRMSMRDNAGGSMQSNTSGHPREGKKLQAGGAAAAMRVNAPKPAPTPKPTLCRSASVESDSSFVRDRPRKEGFQMKRSMRGSYSREAPTLRGPSPVDATPAQSSRFSIRSLSPSSRRLSISSTTRPTPSLRTAPDEPPKSPRRLFSRTKAIPAPKAFKPSSRFADSSDEEDARPATTFRSRFADCSDEEDDVPPPPVTGSFRRPRSLRPIPRSSAADGDSSDLPDSDDSPPFRGASGVNAAALRMARANFEGGGNATEISAADFREAPRKKGGLMSILRRKKPEQSGRIQRTDWDESAARRDTPLERSKTDLEVVKSRDGNVRSVQSPRLQKRAGPPRTARYQAPPTVEAQADGRPATSDGVADEWKANGEGGGVVNGASASRPGVLRRNSTAGSVEIIGGDGKKKKFGLLRRLFGN
ncbi:hypothetical protein VC83_02804 [Pseudogymnoascus destructans]|uniref:Uncharacterized protein n=2 Tax=Pseudogymnoascus destructans TaxID=655981 RepID=L8FYX3_PSED2|nr:uncharacterized protein VC83_02804 [Pseudogymnoascus destructans]ELR04916.1 hypothetical protein GMDG_00175 [Pseudogymnoascus destructans 20631-21]OAF60305.2 hypothetical protein VC83_02804 [Pseudogymnoascus destructans]